ncbi:DUF4113 domain-containing protein [Billgrantia kenyensis]
MTTSARCCPGAGETRYRSNSGRNRWGSWSAYERNDRLMATLDNINGRMGRGTVTFGRPSPGAAWHLRCANRTPRWTTRWDELPSVR